MVWAWVGDCEDGDLDARKGEAQAAPVDYVSFLFVGLEVLYVFEQGGVRIRNAVAELDLVIRQFELVVEGETVY